MSSYNDGQVDASLREQRIVQDRARLRAELRAEFLKQSSNPYRHMQGEGHYGGYLFDPAMQRWISTRANEYFYFKPTAKTLIFPAFVFGSIVSFAWLLHWHRGKKEHQYRTGQVAYKDRDMKFV